MNLHYSRFLQWRIAFLNIPKITSSSLEEMRFYLEDYKHWVTQVDYGLLFIESEESLSL